MKTTNLSILESFDVIAGITKNSKHVATARNMISGNARHVRNRNKAIDIVFYDYTNNILKR